MRPKFFTGSGFVWRIVITVLATVIEMSGGTFITVTELTWPVSLEFAGPIITVTELARPVPLEFAGPITVFLEALGLLTVFAESPGFIASWPLAMGPFRAATAASFAHWTIVCHQTQLP
jgi:hypothetical protein